ncbi:MAG: hypothetical protein AB1757_15185 [Acidobacteriota bacterium]
MRVVKFVSLTFFLFIPFIVNASTPAPFDPYSYAWFSTHIVIVTEGTDIDGRVTVIESLKGDLKPGEELFFPELKPFKDMNLRIIKDFGDNVSGLNLVLGKKMVLFLTEKPLQTKFNQESSILENTNPNVKEWEPFEKVNHYYLPVIWFENDDAYFFLNIEHSMANLISVKSFADSVEGKVNEFLRKNILEVVGAKEIFDRAMETEDLIKRASTLESISKTNVREVNLFVISALFGCKKAAIPGIKRIINDLDRMDNAFYIFRRIERFESAELENEIINIIREDQEFLKIAEQNLPANYKDDLFNPEYKDIRHRIFRFSGAVYVLAKRLNIVRKDEVNEILDFIYYHREVENNFEQIKIGYEKNKKEIN